MVAKGASRSGSQNSRELEPEPEPEPEPGPEPEPEPEPERSEDVATKEVVESIAKRQTRLLERVGAAKVGMDSVAERLGRLEGLISQRRRRNAG